MKKYKAQHIFNLQFIIASYEFDEISDRVKKEDVLADNDIKTILARVDFWEKNLKYLNLDFSLRFLQEIRERLKTPITFSEFEAQVEIFSGRIDHAFEDIVFGFIPKEKVPYFDQDELFGKEVSDSFPTAKADIKEAGNCYAHASYTASVFHLMRSVEIASKIMVNAMGAQKYLLTSIQGGKKIVKKPVELCDWGTLIKGLEKALTTLEQGTKTSVPKKETFAFYSHAIAQFRCFKDAWRNNVSHSRKIYQAGETKDIMDNTRHFLQHLAKRIKE